MGYKLYKVLIIYEAMDINNWIVVQLLSCLFEMSSQSGWLVNLVVAPGGTVRILDLVLRRAPT